jgi:hypothetical protein
MTSPLVLTRHRRIVSFFFSDKTVSEVAFLCRCTQDRVRRTWKLAQAQGDLPPIERPREGFGWLSVFLGPIGNQCSPELRRAS